MENLKLYNDVRKVPEEAQKIIGGGRLKGFTDINPMWRIKSLTEQFGVCGIGWKYEIVNQELKQGANGEIAAFVSINLFIKYDGEWSDGIPGIGGSMFVSNEKNGLYTSDECFKMAFTDALGIACKALGFAADIYFAKDRTKYDVNNDNASKPNPEHNNKPKPKLTGEALLKAREAVANGTYTEEFILSKYDVKAEDLYEKGTL